MDWPRLGAVLHTTVFWGWSYLGVGRRAASRTWQKLCHREDTGLPWGKPYRGRIHIWDYPKGNQFFPPITYPTHGKKLAQRGDCRILWRLSVSPSPQFCRCRATGRLRPGPGGNGGWCIPPGQVCWIASVCCCTVKNCWAKPSTVSPNSPAWEMGASRKCRRPSSLPGWARDGAPGPPWWTSPSRGTAPCLSSLVERSQSPCAAPASTPGRYYPRAPVWAPWLGEPAG